MPQNTDPITITRVSHAKPEGIVSSACVVDAVTWHLEDKVMQAYSKSPAPSAYPIIIFLSKLTFAPRFCSGGIPQFWPATLELPGHPHLRAPQATALVGFYGKGYEGVSRQLSGLHPLTLSLDFLPQMVTLSYSLWLIVAPRLLTSFRYPNYHLPNKHVTHVTPYIPSVRPPQ